MRQSAIVLILLAAAVTAQEQPKPTFRTEANYVRVDVFATLDGKPVTDLTRDDFELTELNQPQAVDTFEHIVISGVSPQETRVEPNTVAQSREMLANSRARVFVLFLDTGHVSVTGSHNIRKPLSDALDRIIGPDDLIGVMTPEMSARDITFARKTTTIEGFLTRYWTWGERDQLNSKDPVEDQYGTCYPGRGPTPRCADDDRGVADEMIARRREKHALDAMEDLVLFLRGVREERKAVIAITDGWLLYRPNPGLERRLDCAPPNGPEVGVDPRTGKLSAQGTAGPGGSSQSMCDRDRAQLAQIDDDLEFRRLLDEANRSNTAFYPVDPRGLAVFDTPITSNTSLQDDSAMLHARGDSLRTLAEGTDGLAILGSNNLAAGLNRVVTDLSDYYLLGYYSNQRLDGKFHSITVRVKRPGVKLRARRGYLAADARDVSAAREAAAGAEKGVSPAEAAEARAIEGVTAPLENFSRELPMRLIAASGYSASGSPAVWLVGELGSTEARADQWRAGGSADVQVLSGGSTLASARVTIEPGSRVFKVAVPLETTVAPGALDVRVRARGGSSTLAVNVNTGVALADSPLSSGAMFVRRGPTTGNKDVPTADLRFRRTEQLRVEVPAADKPLTHARLLDRTGKLIPLPLTVTEKDESGGARWETVQTALAALAPGDYIVELTGDGRSKLLVGFRVVP